MAAGLDDWAADNLLGYLREQREATGHVPDDRAIVVERFRDELGDWRVAILSPFGAQVHAPWALAVSARMRDRFGVDVQAMHGDDGIVLRLPDLELDDLDGVRERGVGRELLDLVTLDPDDVRGLVTEEIGGSALFAARFRECAARALLLPRRRPDRRQPLWQQRQRASQLLEVASQYPTFPIVLEAVRECVQDVFDVPGLVDLMRDIGSRKVTVVDVESSTPSPFAKSLLFGYVAQFLYEGDSPLAERRAAALALDPSLLAELLGTSEGLALRDLLDAEQIARTEAELQRLTPERAARDADDVLDLLRSLGPLPVDGILARCREGTTGDDVEAWLAGLDGARQVIPVRVAGEDRWSAIDDASRLRDALGVSLPPGVPQAFLEPVADPLGDLVARYARTHVPFHAAEVARAYGLGPAVATTALARLVSSGPGRRGRAAAHRRRRHRVLRRRGAAHAAAAARWPRCGPRSSRSPRSSWPASCQGWQGVGGRLRGRDGLVRVVEQLSGAVLPASALESLVLPARVADYTPALLDELMATGEVLWCGHGSLPGDDGWLSLHLADSAHVTLPGPDPDRVPVPRRAGGARRPGRWWRALLPHPVRPGGLHRRPGPGHHALGPRVVGPGHRRHLRPGARPAVRRPHRPPAHPHPAPAAPATPAAAARSGGSAPPRPGPRCPARTGPPQVSGRWSLLPPVDLDPTLRAYATAELLLDRHGILTRGATAAEDVPGGFAAIYRVLGRAEEAGRVRRGYFVEGLGRLPVRHDRCGRPAAQRHRRRGGGRAATVVARHRWPSCSPRATRPTRTARRCPGPTAPSTPRRSTPARPATTRPPTSAAGTSRAQGRRRRRARRRRPGALRRAGRQDPADLRRRPRPPAGRGHRPRGCRAARQPGPDHRREGRRRPGARLRPPASWPPSRRPASTSRRAVCGCVGDDERPRRPPGEHGDRRAHRRPQRPLGHARRGEVERRTHGADPADPAQQHPPRAGRVGPLGGDRHGHRPPEHGRDARGDPQLRWERALVAAAPRQPPPRRPRGQRRPGTP